MIFSPFRGKKKKKKAKLHNQLHRGKYFIGENAKYFIEK